MPDIMSELAQQLDLLRRRTHDTAEDLRKMEQDQEAFALHYHECTKINGKRKRKKLYSLFYDKQVSPQSKYCNCSRLKINTFLNNFSASSAPPDAGPKSTKCGT